MRQLSGLDNIFLEAEDGRQHMHVAALGIYDPSTAPGGSLRFKTVLDYFAHKIDEVPFFRRRLVKVPLGLDRPYLIDDAGVDVEYHVRHLALPEPGDWRQLMIQVARLHARELDRAHPLWEVYIIGGLDNIEGISKGSFAMYLKLHHAVIDGQAGSQLIQLLHSTTPEFEAWPDTSVVYTDREPGNVELLARAAVNRGQQLLRAPFVFYSLGKSAVSIANREGAYILESAVEGVRDRVASVLLNSAGGDEEHPTATRFDRAISPHRIVDARGLPLEKFKLIRRHVADVTVNDIFMATTGGAMRRYLGARNDLPARSLNAMMPIAVSGKDRGESGNVVSMTIVPIRTDIEDPIERLLRISRDTAKSKNLYDDIGRDLMVRLFDVMPYRAGKFMTERLVQKNCSLAISNVRGPGDPLYLAGARAEAFMPVSFPYDEVGVNVTGFSYLDTLWVTVTACRELLPDPEFFSECLLASFDELVDAATA